jgi:hypothetical protein
MTRAAHRNQSARSTGSKTLEDRIHYGAHGHASIPKEERRAEREEGRKYVTSMQKMERSAATVSKSA